MRELSVADGAGYNDQFSAISSDSAAGGRLEA
jgi:hypothetical protein